MTVTVKGFFVVFVSGFLFVWLTSWSETIKIYIIYIIKFIFYVTEEKEPEKTENEV